MEYEIEDLMSSAIAQKPLDFGNAFKSIMLDRITDAIETRKIDVAKNNLDKSKERRTRNRNYGRNRIMEVYI